MDQAITAHAFKVFVVEDSAAVRERLLEMLGSIEGVETIGSAAGAETAVRGILATRPDTVILDLNLAQGSGFDVLRAVQLAAPEIEIWMLTNFAAEPYRKTCSRLGAARFFDKTHEIEQLRDSIATRAMEHRIH